MNGVKRKVAIPVTIVAGFVFAVSFFTLYAQTHIMDGTSCSCTLPIPILIPVFSSLGVMVGTIVYYFVVGKATERVREIRIENKGEIKESARKIVGMLQGDERKIVNMIIGNGGTMLQSRISKTGGMHKVKVFRVVERLVLRGIVEKKKYGKTNSVILTNEFKNILC